MAHGASDAVAWSDDASELAARLATGPDGLTSTVARERLTKVGPNSVDEAPRLGTLRLAAPIGLCNPDELRLIGLTTDPSPPQNQGPISADIDTMITSRGRLAAVRVPSHRRPTNPR
jgi:hypothetical protein